MNKDRIKNDPEVEAFEDDLHCGFNVCQVKQICYLPFITDINQFGA